MNRFLTTRLASKAGTRSAELLVHADSAAGKIAGDVLGVYQILVQRMQAGHHNAARNYHVAYDCLAQLPTFIWTAQRWQIKRLLVWSHDQAANAMIATLPRPYLRAAMQRKLRRLQETHIRERGPVAFGLRLTPDGAELTTEAPVLSPSAEEDAWRQFLFPPPSDSHVKSVLDAILPESDIPAGFSTGPGAPDVAPMQLAQFIANGYAAGKSTAKISREVRPYFDGSAMRAARAVRTLGAYVGTERNLATSEALGDLILGYQVHSAGGENARHNHAMRSGTVYYREPKGQQYGMDVMPHPPVDTGRGPYDDREGLNYNCRCWITPVLAPQPAMSEPAFVDNTAALIPDPSHFADWFETATPPQRAKAAGVRRLAVAEGLLGRPPGWADLVDPDTGMLLTLDELRSETVEQRSERRTRVATAIATNRALTRQVATLGTSVPI